MANVPRERECLLLQVREFLLQIRADLILAQPLLETAEGDRHTSQLLAHVVVQVARDARAFRFLGGDQAAGEILILFGHRAVLLLALPQRQLGAAAPGALDHQSGDQRALQPDAARPPRRCTTGIDPTRVGCRNWTMLPAGRRASLMPQRWSSRQSNVG